MKTNWLCTEGWDFTKRDINKLVTPIKGFYNGPCNHHKTERMPAFLEIRGDTLVILEPLSSLSLYALNVHSNPSPLNNNATATAIDLRWHKLTGNGSEQNGHYIRLFRDRGGEELLSIVFPSGVIMAKPDAFSFKAPPLVLLDLLFLLHIL